jgi:neutral ceramidase
MRLAVLGLAIAAAGCSSAPLPAPSGWERAAPRIERSLRAEGDLRAGAARVSLDPPYAVPMAGYFGGNLFLLRGQRDPLFARAAVLEAGGLRLAIVSLDLLLIPPELRPLVEEREEFRAARIDGWTVAASHAHTCMGAFAPQWPAQAFGVGKFDPLILRFIARQAARAVAGATEHLQPVDGALGSAASARDEPPLSFNRRSIGGPIDPAMRVLGLWPRGAGGDGGEGGRAGPASPSIRLVSFAAHPTMIPSSRRSASADYPGGLARDLEADGSIALFLNGPCADIGAGMRKDEQVFWERRMPLEGHRLAGLARRAFEAAKVRLDAPAVLACSEGEVLLPPRHPWRLPLIGRSIAAQYPDRVRVRCLRIGDLALVSFPGEMGVALGAQVRDAFQGPEEIAAGLRPRTLWVVTLADDYLGYAFSTEEYRKGGHSQHLTIYGEELGDVVRRGVEGVVRAAFTDTADTR